MHKVSASEFKQTMDSDTYQIFDADKHTVTFDKFGHGIVHHMDNSQVNDPFHEFVRFTQADRKEGDGHDELIQTTTSDHSFFDVNTGVTSLYRLAQMGAQYLHLTAPEMDQTDASSLIRKTGRELLEDLNTVRNPRTIISGTTASFGLHQTSTVGPTTHFVMSQQAPAEESRAVVTVDSMATAITNNATQNGLGGWSVSFKGYDDATPQVLQHDGLRLGVNNL